MTEQSQGATQVPIDVNLRVGQFVKLRDMKKELQDKHTAELKPINDALDALTEVLKQALANVSAESLRTDSGTISKSTKQSASIADMDTFWAHVVTSGTFDLVDKKANVTGVRDYIDTHGVPPPGVNYTQIETLNVRRPSSK